VHIKRDSSPKWALGAAGFKLVVRPGTISVLGPGESQFWYFSGPESSVEWVHEGTKEWIVIAGTESGHQARIWVSPIDRNRLWEVWSALVSENATPLTEPPLPG
jgi:hypothetical protein